MPKTKLQVPERDFKIQEQKHEGWLPTSAREPRPIAARFFRATLRIEGDDQGYFLICESKDSALSSDTWYPSLSEAMDHAKRSFGVETSDWKETV